MSSSPVARILDWLRAGYPEGIPLNDFPPVLGVLRRNLTEADIDAIAEELAMQSMSNAVEPVTADQIRAMVHDQALQSPTEQDLRRVSARLAAGGWPLSVERD